MTISRKRKRSIAVDGVEYLWWVGEGNVYTTPPSSKALVVVMVDGEFHVRYALDQPAQVRHIEVLGRQFRAVAGCGVRHRRFLCPLFGQETVLPSDVAALIRWATEAGSDPIELDYRGQPMPTNILSPNVTSE